ncbi:hypothetical protein D3C73_1510480 [compost metagenome]
MLFALGRRLRSPHAGALIANVCEGRRLEPQKRSHFLLQTPGRRQILRPILAKPYREPVLRHG